MPDLPETIEFSDGEKSSSYIRIDIYTEARAEILGLKAEIERLEKDIDCGGGPAGCLNTRRMCRSCLIQAHEAYANAETERLKERLFIKARTDKRHEQAYTDSELLEMFAPFLLDGITKGLSPRECRLLETVADANAEIERLKTEIERCRPLVEAVWAWRKSEVLHAAEVIGLRVCTCGHSKYHHADEHDEVPTGSGRCNACSCGRFDRAKVAANAAPRIRQVTAGEMLWQDACEAAADSAGGE